MTSPAPSALGQGLALLAAFVFAGAMLTALFVTLGHSTASAVGLAILSALAIAAVGAAGALCLHKAFTVQDHRA